LTHSKGKARAFLAENGKIRVESGKTLRKEEGDGRERK